MSIPADGWQPIETAPKDGTEILGFWPGCAEGQIATTLWSEVLGGWCDPCDPECEWLSPAHWQPLPPPPGASRQPTDVERLAEAVTERIFGIGREHDKEPHRIEYKVMWGGREVGAGGLAKEPFTRYVREALDSAMAAQKEGRTR